MVQRKRKRREASSQTFPTLYSPEHVMHNSPPTLSYLDSNNAGTVSFNMSDKATCESYKGHQPRCSKNFFLHPHC